MQDYNAFTKVKLNKHKSKDSSLFITKQTQRDQQNI